METENDSTDANNSARSPVLGSSTFKRKFLRTKCSRKNAKLRLSDRFEDELLFSDRPKESTSNSISNCRPDNQFINEHKGSKENEGPIERCTSSEIVSTKKEQHKARFQTASGKPLFSKEESSDFANKLMSEFINPLALSVREKKYSFLSKSSVKGNMKSEITKCNNISKFLGFEDQEYRYSLEKARKLHIITSRTLVSTIDVQNFIYTSKNDELELHISDNLCAINIKNTYSELKRIDDTKVKILANFQVSKKEGHSFYNDSSSLGFTENLTSSEGKFVKTNQYMRDKVRYINEDSASYIGNKNSNSKGTKSKESISSGVERGYVSTGKIKGQNLPQANIGSDEKNSISSLVDIPDITNVDDAVLQSNTPRVNLQFLQEEIFDKQNRKIANDIECNFPQFATASGKKIIIPSNELSEIHGIFKDIAGVPDDFKSNSESSGNCSNGEINLENVKQNHENNSADNTVTNFPTELDKINTLIKTNDQFNDSEMNKTKQSYMKTNNSTINPTLTTEKFTEKVTSTSSGEKIKSTSCDQNSWINESFDDFSDSKDIKTNSNEKFTEQRTPLFSTASGKPLKLQSSLSKIDNIFKDIPGFSSGKKNYNEECTNEIPPLFSTASGKTIKLPSSNFSGINKIFEGIADFSNLKINKNEKPTEEIPPPFSTASGKSLKSPSSSLVGIEKISGNIPDFNHLKTNKNEKSTEEVPSLFTTASGKSIKLPSSNLEGIEKIFEDIPDFSHLKKKEDEKPTEIFEDIPDFSHLKKKEDEKPTEEIPSLFSTASGKSLKLPSSSLARINNIFEDIPDYNDVKTKSKGFTVSRKTKISGNHHTPLKNNITKDNDNKPFKLDEIIKQETDTKIDENKNNTNYITPQRSLPKKRRLGSTPSKSGKLSEVAMNKAKSLFGDLNFDDLKLPSQLKFGSPSLTVGGFTPKKLDKISIPQYSSTPIRNDSLLSDFPQAIKRGVAIHKANKTALNVLEEELRSQRISLEKELEFVTKRHEAIKMQIEAECSNRKCKLEPQVKKNKLNLKDVKNLEAQSDYTGVVSSNMLQINPQNAVLVHFYDNWQKVPTVTTEDGCTLVPNRQGSIGISEIEPAFCSMPGIETKLIPEGWIKNHYRWIIWKLASYERFFPATLGGCCTVDNVIRQLKYRYFREIYNTERPALRKIYEKDDIPQKRMVLCISNIIKNGDNTELELTDGWYSIRTIVDDALCYQINNKKIEIGSKVITSGAELVNCEGCHPLESEEARKVRLKINFNSTRRAAWFCKLGYQRDASPLSIKLSSAIWNGGNIGRITVYIMRVYPVMYREKTEAKIFWRNQNAEYKKMQEYENECLNKYEEDVNVNIVRRNVCSLLQMTVIDVSDNIPKPFKCTIWDSTDSHQEQLKENQVVTCYNLTLRCNGELSCNKKSYFQPFKDDTEKYRKYRRKYVELAVYPLMLENATFREFDTIGFIVKLRVEQNSQYFWLTDLMNNFLLVKIIEGPNQCLLLNKVEEECLVAVCNLLLHSSIGGYVIATAGFQTIITQNPQYDFLRQKIEELGTINRDEIQSKLEESKKIIDNFGNGNEADLASHTRESEENTLNFSKATSTDAVMSMINIDEIVSKHTM